MLLWVHYTHCNSRKLLCALATWNSNTNIVLWSIHPVHCGLAVVHFHLVVDTVVRTIVINCCTCCLCHRGTILTSIDSTQYPADVCLHCCTTSRNTESITCATTNAGVTIERTMPWCVSLLVPKMISNVNHRTRLFVLEFNADQPVFQFDTTWTIFDCGSAFNKLETIALCQVAVLNVAFEIDFTTCVDN